MTEPFTFYRALDPMRGSWDGYGFIRLQDTNFLAYVTDAPSVASAQTPELIRSFWNEYCRSWTQRNSHSGLAKIELADGINRLQDLLSRKSRNDGTAYQATLSVAYKFANQLYYCTVGDSPLSLYRHGRLYRLSGSEIWDGGFILEQGQTCRERQKTGALQFVGNGGMFIHLAEIFSLQLEKDDLLILHSDGVEDLLAPDQMLPLLKKEPASLRKDLERVFAQERLKDDVTILVVPVDVPPMFEPQKEIEALRLSLDSLRKEQSNFRNDLTRLAVPQQKLEKIEKALQQLSHQVQSLSNRVTSASDRPQSGIWNWRNPAFWLLLLSVFASGAAVLFGLLFLSTPVQEPARTTSPPRTATPPAERRAPITPPVIEPSGNCTYIVQKGDTLQKIAQEKQLTLSQLVDLNPALKKNAILQVGQQITLCGEGQ